MKKGLLSGVLLLSVFGAACEFENTAKLLTPTAPSNTVGGVAGAAPVTSSGSGSTGTSTPPASGFGGVWGSPSFAGLPVGNCADLKWLITDQSATSLGGTVSATCAGGATVSASLTGQMASEHTVNLAASGTIMASGVSCPFNLTGIGTRQSDDSMLLVYQGTYCLGTLSGTETLRRFPSAP